MCAFISATGSESERLSKTDRSKARRSSDIPFSWRSITSGNERKVEVRWRRVERIVNGKNYFEFSIEDEGFSKKKACVRAKSMRELLLRSVAVNEAHDYRNEAAWSVGGWGDRGVKRVVQDAREREAEGSEQGLTRSEGKAAEKLPRRVKIAGMEVWADAEGRGAACGGGMACGELGAGDGYGAGTSMRRAYSVFRERRHEKCAAVYGRVGAAAGVGRRRVAGVAAEEVDGGVDSERDGGADARRRWRRDGTGRAWQRTGGRYGSGVDGRDADGRKEPPGATGQECMMARWHAEGTEGSGATGRGRVRALAGGGGSRVWARAGHGAGRVCREKRRWGRARRRTGGRREASYTRRGDTSAKEDGTGVPRRRRGEDAVARRNGMGLRADTGGVEGTGIGTRVAWRGRGRRRSGRRVRGKGSGQGEYSRRARRHRQGRVRTGAEVLEVGVGF
ncbi:hypothetical protein B0H14DRAFT_3590439 [Mycena olivaceomarginata]|nr:hypothetical protein B0H14DRAFT_3590439 [Mycena olivaceomarginata]